MFERCLFQDTNVSLSMLSTNLLLHTSLYRDVLAHCRWFPLFLHSRVLYWGFPCGGTMACTLGSCLGHSMSLLMTWPMSLMVGLGGRWDTFQIFFSLQTFQIGFFVEHIQELAASEISSTDPNSVKCLHSFLLQHIFFAIVLTNFFILLSHISFLCVLKHWNCFDECFTFLFESLWSANFTNQKWRKNLKKMHWLQRITRYLKVIQVMALLKAYTKTQIYN